MTYPNQNDPGGVTIALANSSCPADFLASPNNGGAYKVWVTPVTSFVGDPTKVDNSCGTGCFHGFVPSATKTDNFKINFAAGTFCLTVKKVDDTSMPVAGWPFSVIDTVGVTNGYFTDQNGIFSLCGQVPGAYTVSEDPGSIIIGLTVNGTPLPPAALTTVYSFAWSAGQPNPFIIVFQNCLVSTTCQVGMPN